MSQVNDQRDLRETGVALEGKTFDEQRIVSYAMGVREFE